MELTREKALELHRQMWGDMQDDLGDNPEPVLRAEYKGGWVRKHFPGEKVSYDCFLCNYVDKLPYRGAAGCRHCPIDWSSLTDEKEGYCFKPYKGSGDCIYLDAPISEILALPEREV